MTADLRVRLVSWTWTLMTMESMASANILTPAMDCRSESASASSTAAAAASAAAEVAPSAVESVLRQSSAKLMLEKDSHMEWKMEAEIWAGLARFFTWRVTVRPSMMN